MNIHVGNLAREATEDELKHAFEAFGEVTSVTIIRDRNNGQSKGFGFVEMSSSAEAEAAIAGLKGKMLKERTLDITEARPNTGGKGRKSGSFAGRKGPGFGGPGKKKRR